MPFSRVVRTLSRLLLILLLTSGAAHANPGTEPYPVDREVRRAGASYQLGAARGDVSGYGSIATARAVSPWWGGSEEASGGSSAWRVSDRGAGASLCRGLHYDGYGGQPRAARYGWVPHTDWRWERRSYTYQRIFHYPVVTLRWQRYYGWLWVPRYVIEWRIRIVRIEVPYWTWASYTSQRYEQVEPARAGRLAWYVGWSEGGSGRCRIVWEDGSRHDKDRLTLSGPGTLSSYQVLHDDLRARVRKLADAAGVLTEAATAWSVDAAAAQCGPARAGATHRELEGDRRCLEDALQRLGTALRPALADVHARRAALLEDYAWRGDDLLARADAARAACAEGDACLGPWAESLLTLERRLLSAYADHEGQWTPVTGGTTPWHLAAYRSVRLGVGDAAETVYLCRAGAVPGEAAPATSRVLGWARPGTPGCAVADGDGTTTTAERYALLRLDYLAANRPDLGLAAVYHDPADADPMEEGPVLHGTRRGLGELHKQLKLHHGKPTARKTRYHWVDAFPEAVIEATDGPLGRRLLADPSHYHRLDNGKLVCRRSAAEPTHGTFVLATGTCTIDGAPVEDGYQLLSRGLDRRARIPAVALLEQGPALWDALRPVSGPAASDLGIPEYVCEDYAGREGVLDAGLECRFFATYPEAANDNGPGLDFFLVLAEGQGRTWLNTRSACQVYHRGEYLVGTVHQDQCLVSLPSTEAAEETTSLAVYASGNHRRLGLPAGRFVDVADVDAERIDGAWLTGPAGHHGATLCRAEIDGVRYPGMELPGTDGPYCLVTVVTVAEDAANDDPEALVSYPVAAADYHVAVTVDDDEAITLVTDALSSTDYECAASVRAVGKARKKQAHDHHHGHTPTGYRVTSWGGDDTCYGETPGLTFDRDAFVLRFPAAHGESQWIDPVTAGLVAGAGARLWQIEHAVATVGAIEDAAMYGADGSLPPYYTFPTEGGVSRVGGPGQLLRRDVADTPGQAGLRLWVPSSVGHVDLHGVDLQVLVESGVTPNLGGRWPAVHPRLTRPAGLLPGIDLDQLLQQQLMEQLRKTTETTSADLLEKAAMTRAPSLAGRALLATELAELGPAGWVVDVGLAAYTVWSLADRYTEYRKRLERAVRQEREAAIRLLNLRYRAFADRLGRTLVEASSHPAPVAGAVSLAWRMSQLQPQRPTTSPYADVAGIPMTTLGRSVIDSPSNSLGDQGDHDGGDHGEDEGEDGQDKDKDGLKKKIGKELKNPLLRKTRSKTEKPRTTVELLPANCRFLTYHRKAHFMGPGWGRAATAKQRLTDTLPPWNLQTGMGFTRQEIERITPPEKVIRNSWCIYEGELKHPAREDATELEDGRYRIATNTLAAIKRTTTRVNGRMTRVSDEVVSLGPGVSVEFPMTERPDQWAIKQAGDTYVLRAWYRHKEPMHPDPELNSQQERGAMGSGTSAGVFLPHDGSDRFVRAYKDPTSLLYGGVGTQSGPRYTLSVGEGQDKRSVATHMELWVAGDPVLDKPPGQYEDTVLEWLGLYDRLYPVHVEDVFGGDSSSDDGSSYDDSNGEGGFVFADPLGIQIVDLGYRGLDTTRYLTVDLIYRNEPVDDIWKQAFGPAFWNDRGNRWFKSPFAFPVPGDPYYYEHGFLVASVANGAAYDGYGSRGLIDGAKFGMMNGTYNEARLQQARLGEYLAPEAIIASSVGIGLKSSTTWPDWYENRAFPASGVRAAFVAAPNLVGGRLSSNLPVRNRHRVSQCNPPPFALSPGGGNPAFCAPGLMVPVMTAPESPYESGASIATPRVASMAVIAQQVAKEIMGREWDAEELKRLLHESARLPEWGIADEEAHGYDPRYGFGLVRLDRVIQNARLAASMRKRADQGNGLNGEPKWYSSFEKEVRRGRERTVRHVFHEAIWNAARDRALLDKSAKNMLKDRLDPQTTQVFHVDPGAPVKLRVPFDDMLPVNGKGAVIDTVNFELLLSGYVVFNGMESLLAQTPRMINPKRLNSEDQKAALAGLQALLVSRMTAKLKTNDEREVSVFADASMVEENDWPEVPFEDADGKPASYGSFLSTRETSYSLQDFGARRQDGHLKPYKNPDTGLKRVTTVEGLYLARLDSLWMQIGIDDSKRRGRNLVEDVHSYIRKNLPELMLEAVRPQDLRIELYVDVPRVTVEAWDPVPQ